MVISKWRTSHSILCETQNYYFDKSPSPFGNSNVGLLMIVYVELQNRASMPLQPEVNGVIIRLLLDHIYLTPIRLYCHEFVWTVSIRQTCKSKCLSQSLVIAEFRRYDHARCQVPYVLCPVPSVNHQFCLFSSFLKVDSELRILSESVAVESALAFTWVNNSCITLICCTVAVPKSHELASPTKSMTPRLLRAFILPVALTGVGRCMPVIYSHIYSRH